MKPVTVSAALLTALFATIAFAYPNGYPKAGSFTEIAIQPELQHTGYLQFLPNPDNNEFLALWLARTEDGVESLFSMRLDGNTLEPLQEMPTEYLRVNDPDNRIADPENPAFHLVNISAVSGSWDPDAGDYVIALALTSQETEPGDDTPRSRHGIYLGNTDDPFTDTAALLADGATHELSAFHNATSAAHYIFWHCGPNSRRPTLDAAGGICAATASLDSNDGISVDIAPHEVVSVADVTPSNDFQAFLLSDLAVAFDEATNTYLVATTIGEFELHLDDGGQDPSLIRSDIVIQVVDAQLSPVNEHAVIASNRSVVKEWQSTESHSGQWPVHQPQIIAGPNEESGHQWLVLFRGFDTDSDGDERIELFGSLIQVASNGSVTRQLGADERISHNRHFGSLANHLLSVSGFYMPAIDRYITPWTQIHNRDYGQVHAATIKPLNGDGAGLNMQLTEQPIETTASGFSRFRTAFIPGLDGKDVFLFVETADRFLVRKIDFRWQDLSTVINAEPGIVGHEENALVNVIVSRADTFNINGTPAIATVANFDSGEYRLHLQLPDHLDLVSVDERLTELPNGAFALANSEGLLQEGEMVSFEFQVRNTNPDPVDVDGNIDVIVEGPRNRIDFDTSNDADAIPVTLSGSPVSDEPDDGDSDSGDDGSGDDGSGDDGSGDDGSGDDGSGDDGSGDDGSGDDGSGDDGSGDDGSGDDGSGDDGSGDDGSGDDGSGDDGSGGGGSGDDGSGDGGSGDDGSGGGGSGDDGSGDDGSGDDGSGDDGSGDDGSGDDGSGDDGSGDDGSGDDGSGGGDSSEGGAGGGGSPGLPLLLLSGIVLISRRR